MHLSDVSTFLLVVLQFHLVASFFEDFFPQKRLVEPFFWTPARLFEFNLHWPQLSWAKVKAFPNFVTLVQRHPPQSCAVHQKSEKALSLVHWWHILKLILSASLRILGDFGPSEVRQFGLFNASAFGGPPILTQGGMCKNETMGDTDVPNSAISRTPWDGYLDTQKQQIILSLDYTSHHLGTVTIDFQKKQPQLRRWRQSRPSRQPRMMKDLRKVLPLPEKPFRVRRTLKKQD